MNTKDMMIKKMGNPWRVDAPGDRESREEIVEVNGTKCRLKS